MKPEFINHTIAGRRIGFIKYLVRHQTIEILDIQVNIDHRREGIGSELLGCLMTLADFQGCKKITTPSGTRSGRAWLISNGFVKDQKTNDWILIL